MFSLTTRSAYGLLALLELGLAYGNGTRQTRTIAEKRCIPQKYLEQILLIFRKANIVESYRGIQGGYTLAQDPSKIKILEVLTLLEGELRVIPDQSKSSELLFFWNGLQEHIHSYLDTNLEQLILNYKNQSEKLMYAI